MSVITQSPDVATNVREALERVANGRLRVLPFTARLGAEHHLPLDRAELIAA